MREFGAQRRARRWHGSCTSFRFEVTGGREVGPRGHAIFTAFANAAGLPAVAVPCGFAQGMPVGMQLVARPGDDMRLLALARQYDSVHRFCDAVPIDPR